MKLRPSTTTIAVAVTIALLWSIAGGVTQSLDEESRKHLLHELGGPFFISRDNVQEDLKFSHDQKQKLREKLSDDIQAARAVENLNAGERAQAMQSLRRNSSEKLETFLKQFLTPDQLQRFQQLKLQYDEPAIMLQPATVSALQISDGQRQQCMAAIQGMQKEIEPLMKAAKSGGNPREILPQVIQLRQECQRKIEALLSDAQKKQWQEMVGKPLVIW